MLTEGDAAIDAEPLSPERFAGWARYPRIVLRSAGLEDRKGALRWDVLRGLHVTRAGKRVFILRNDGCYLVRNDILFGRLAVSGVAIANFVAPLAALLGGERHEDAPPFLASNFNEC